MTDNEWPLEADFSDIRPMTPEERKASKDRDEKNKWRKCVSCGKMINSEWRRLIAEQENFKETVMAEHTADIVNEPAHYARWEIEPITYIMLNDFEFWRGNIVKYASRAGFKLYDGKTKDASEIVDLEKVIRYAEMRINQLNGCDKL